MGFTPLFIAGCDRSGTTMLGDLLGATPDSFATPESQWIHRLGPRLHLGLLADADAVARALLDDFRFAVWNIHAGPDELARKLNTVDARSIVDSVVQLYLEQKQPGKKAARYWIDHTPDNFKHYPILKALFPEARYLHIVRDGRAVHQSIQPLNWGPNNAYMSSRFWAERVELGLQVEMAEGRNCLRVRYEDILREPETELRRICDFSGLRYDASMLDGGGLILPSFTEGQHRLVGRRPDASRVDAWREQLRPAEVETFEAYAPTRELLACFGYDLVTPEPVESSLLDTLWAYVHEFVLYLAHRRSHRQMEEEGVSAKQPQPPVRRVS